MKINLTIAGFGSFHNIKDNTSERIVNHINTQREVDNQWTLHTHVFPVIYRDADKRLESIIRQTKPNIFILTGVNRNIDTLHLECIAKNRDHSHTPDNDGEIYLNHPIVKGEAPQQYVSSLPLDKFVDSLTKMGLPTCLSNDAGGFICNHHYYMTHRIKESLGIPQICLFVHVPDFSTKHQLSIESLSRGVLTLARWIADFMQEKK